jgi:hypothetical protein
MPRTHSSPSCFYHTVETVSILGLLSTYSPLPFEGEASNQSEKTVIVRGHPKVSGEIFSRVLWQLRLQ